MEQENTTAIDQNIYKKLRGGTAALIGLLTTASLTAVLYFANQLVGLPFVPFDLFDLMTGVLPGSVITFGIDSMIDLLLFLGMNVAKTAKSAEQLIAILQFVTLGVIIGLLFFRILNQKKIKSTFFAGMITGILVGVPLLIISVIIGQSTVPPVFQMLWLGFIFIAWGLALSYTYDYMTMCKVETQIQADQNSSKGGVSRRKFLTQFGGATVALTFLSTFGGMILARNKNRDPERELDGTIANRTETGEGLPFPNVNDPIKPAPGTRPEYTAVEDHYKVYIRATPTVIKESKWKLSVSGMVDNPLLLTLNNIKNNYMKQRHYVTLSCISGNIGTSLISTTLWTGVSMQDLLADAKIKDGAKYLHITSGDGYYETLDLKVINDDARIMLCYGWDGRDLPVDHGFPLRIWIPDRYGMKQPKWITSIKVSDQYKKGYWVERNWDKDAKVKTTSVIDTVAVNAIYKNGDQEMIPIGGIAFAGARGISKVEVRADNGPWQEAKLRSPLSETTWVIWRYDWPLIKGKHIFEVRCAEKDGTPQIEEYHSNRPSGATGLHRYEITI